MAAPAGAVRFRLHIAGRHNVVNALAAAACALAAGAPLDQDSSIKGGPYSQGVYKPVAGEGCFGYVQVRDTGGKITVRYSGRNYVGAEKITLNFSVPAN